MSSSTSRPSTSKPRGVCLYYTHPRGCYAADKCKFLHGEPPKEAKPDDPPMLTPYDKAKRCRFYAQGFCKRGDTCWFLHVSDRTSNRTAPSDDEDEELCSICFEKPVTYGLLGGCSHIFCITCIKQWRDPKDKPGGVLDSGNTKRCPMCRVPTNFITPSSKFWKAGTREKDNVVKAYKESMSRVPCRSFQESLQKNKDKPSCPFGKDCFYQHVMADGTPHIFNEGVDVAMRKYRRCGSGGPVIDSFNVMSFSLEFADFLLPIDRSARVIIREQPNTASQSNAADTRPMQPRHRHRYRDQAQHRVNGLTNAARRLQQVGESLERLNDVISEGATLDSLNTAVEALRAGLGRLDANSGDNGRGPDRLTGQRVDGTNDGTADRQEDEVMERLEVLADQMLASIQVLRMNAQEEESERDGAETPLPALESLGGPSGDIMPSPPLRPYGWREDVDDGYESADSMPTLRSVSDSGEDEMILSGDDEDEIPFGRTGDRAVLTATHAIQAFERSQGRTYSDRDAERAASEEHLTTEEEDEDVSSASDIPVAETPTEGEPPRSEPPFVTDGRGRVVWTSPAEEDKSTEEENREQTSRLEVATGSGGLLGWFSALF